MKRLPLILLTTILFISCSSDNESPQEENKFKIFSERLSDETRKEVTDEVIIKEVLSEQEPCLADENYRTPRIKCFAFTDASHNFTHSIVEYLGTDYSIFGWKDDKGWHFIVYHAFNGETC